MSLQRVAQVLSGGERTNPRTTAATGAESPSVKACCRPDVGTTTWKYSECVPVPSPVRLTARTSWERASAVGRG
jgi:hypothetical protein